MTFISVNVFLACNQSVGKHRDRSRLLIGGGGAYSHIQDWLISFEIRFISKEISQAKPEYMIMYPRPARAVVGPQDKQVITHYGPQTLLTVAQ